MTGELSMTDELTWTAPGPGPWQQDSAHNPVSQSLLMQEVYPAGFNRGFEEAFAGYGMLLDRLAMGVVNGFTYHQPQPFDMPGPDGPPDHDWIVGEIGRRTQVAHDALEGQVWRDAIRRWDAEMKPLAQQRHVELATGIGQLDDAALLQRFHDCIEHTEAMVYQHHRMNAHALVPVGEFMLQVSAWTHRPPTSLFAVLDGHSPVSGVSPPEMQAALTGIRANAAAKEQLFSEGAPADVLAQLGVLVPEVADYVTNVHFRLLEGFDVTNPTIGERPASLVGRLRVALGVDHAASLARGDAFAVQLRAEVPEEHRAQFDAMLAEARLVYRLRDERGIYSDVSAVGIMRLVLLEMGSRFTARGRLEDAGLLVDATVGEIDGLFAGADTPTSAELRERAQRRRDLTLAGPPRYLGPPPPAPPDPSHLPPPLGRVMSAVGFTIDGILGQMEHSEGSVSEVVGIPGAPGVYEGRARLVRSIDDLFTLEAGDVLLAPTTGEAFNSMLHVVAAIVTDHGSFASHAAIVSREMGIPSVVGTIDGTKRIPDGAIVRVDGTAGTVTVIG
jgi:pyruvate,water dikinase